MMIVPLFDLFEHFDLLRAALDRSFIFTRMFLVEQLDWGITEIPM